jgi:hypothetical protein
VQSLASAIGKGLLKFLTRPLTMLLKLMLPGEIGAFMIGKMPKLLARPVVRAATRRRSARTQQPSTTAGAPSPPLAMAAALTPAAPRRAATQVNAATHGVVHAVNHALGHGLSRSVTVAVVHALSRAQTHYYYCEPMRLRPPLEPGES